MAAAIHEYTDWERPIQVRISFRLHKINYELPYLSILMQSDCTPVLFDFTFSFFSAMLLLELRDLMYS